jgi:hypothetical protein
MSKTKCQIFSKMCIVFFILVYSFPLAAQLTTKNMVDVYPVESQEVLFNPGIGFMTFQRFNGDDLNPGTGWTEGLPIVYQDFDGNLINENYPQTTIAYFRINWRFIEIEPGVYNWELIDKALKTAAERGQTLMLRISPYEGGEEKDVPVWYRKIIGKENDLKSKKWRVDPENPAYVKYFGGTIAALGQRYDGHPDLEAVDVSFIGFWGEGDGTHLLSEHTKQALVNVYLDNFKKTPLIFQPLNGDAPRPELIVRGTNVAASWPDGSNNGTGTQMRHLGWRVDCLGDMGLNPDWGSAHMLDIYPQDIVKSGMAEAWKRAPVTMEICGTFLRWMNNKIYNKQTVKYIFDQALKWHISSFNAKSSPVPEEWKPLVDEWLKKMGYRFVLRKFTYPELVRPNGQLLVKTWWENKGVAPIYKKYVFAIRLKNAKRTDVFATSADMCGWLPGDIVFEEKLYLPYDMPEGEYQLEIAIIDPVTFKPRVKLANEGMNKDGWYTMGKVTCNLPAD